MPTLRLPNSPQMALLANAIANLADGEFRQDGANGWINLWMDGRVRIDRSALLPVSGREPDDGAWAALSRTPVAGRQIAADDRHIELDD